MRTSAYSLLSPFLSLSHSHLFSRPHLCIIFCSIRVNSRCTQNWLCCTMLQRAQLVSWRDGGLIVTLPLPLCSILPLTPCSLCGSHLHNEICALLCLQSCTPAAFFEKWAVQIKSPLTLTTGSSVEVAQGQASVLPYIVCVHAVQVCTWLPAEPAWEEHAGKSRLEQRKCRFFSLLLLALSILDYR